jgi:hypothetical protein
MYVALWRMIPGPVWVRSAVLFVAAVLVVAALVEWVFPWAADTLLPLESTLEG